MQHRKKYIKKSLNGANTLPHIFISFTSFIRLSVHNVRNSLTKLVSNANAFGIYNVSIISISSTVSVELWINSVGRVQLNLYQLIHAYSILIDFFIRCQICNNKFIHKNKDTPAYLQWYCFVAFFLFRTVVLCNICERYICYGLVCEYFRYFVWSAKYITSSCHKQ